jgi:hypothetical protein
MNTESGQPNTPVECFVMPLLLISKEEQRVFPKSVKIPLDRNEQAIKNHSQTLVRLRQRGGVSPCEAIALMRRQYWTQMQRGEICDWFTRYGWWPESQA